MILFLKQIGILAWKDILIDLRRKENVLSMFFFSILTLIIFNFAIGENPKAFRQLIPGIIWVVFLLAGVLGLNKSFAQEIDNGCLGGLLLTPIDRGTLFIGKLLGTTIFLILVQVLTVPMFILFFDLPVRHFDILIFGLLAGTIGFTSLGTLLAGITSTLRGKEVLLPILLFPMLVPNLISVVKITQYAFFGGDRIDLQVGWVYLASFDTVFLVASYLLFDFIVED